MATPATGEMVADEGSAQQPTDDGSLQPMSPASSPSALLLEGDYYWRSEDGASEVVLKLTGNQQWWHAAHRKAEERCRVAAKNGHHHQSPQNILRAYKDFDIDGGRRTSVAESGLSGHYEPVAIWEIAECLGSWSLLDLAEYRHQTPPNTEALVLLSCKHWNWKCSHPTAPSILRPTDEGAAQLDQLLENDDLTLCYAVLPFESTAGAASEAALAGGGAGAADDKDVCGAAAGPPSFQLKLLPQIMPPPSSPPAAAAPPNLRSPDAAAAATGKAAREAAATAAGTYYGGGGLSAGAPFAQTSKHSRLRSMQCAFQTLGFERSYKRGS
mmetsp:Transcript_54776/g.116969  ORF Transcript_54776/g.116969 Transcript_54776/m.116969 type:complete len:327 (-) Transcript_54776:195-1175(-)